MQRIDCGAAGGVRRLCEGIPQVQSLPSPLYCPLGYWMPCRRDYWPADLCLAKSSLHLLKPLMQQSFLDLAEHGNHTLASLSLRSGDIELPVLAVWGWRTLGTSSTAM